MNNVCGNCVHWKLPSAYAPSPPLEGMCMHLLNDIGYRLSMAFDDYCSKHVLVLGSPKEPTDAASVLMTLLIKQMAELRAEVTLLRDNITCADRRSMDHTLDRGLHLRRPI